MKNWVIILLLLLPALEVYALEMEGVELKEEVVLGGLDSPLVLNGAGIRKKLFFKVYLGSLYLPQRQSSAQDIIASDKPTRVQMDILYSKVEKEKLVSAWNDGFSANLNAEALSVLAERIDRFNAMFDTLVEGDNVQIDYLPDQGTSVTINGVRKGNIPGFDFQQALLRIWLGDEPVTGSLKKAMLGL
jgi:hypothetical protein